MLLIGTAASSDGPLEFEAILCWCLVGFFCISLGSTPQRFRLNWILFYVRKNGQVRTTMDQLPAEADRGAVSSVAPAEENELGNVDNSSFPQQLREHVSPVAPVGQSGGSSTEGNSDGAASRPQHKSWILEKTKRIRQKTKQAIRYLRCSKKPTKVRNNCGQTIVLRIKDRLNVGRKLLTLPPGHDGQIPVNCLHSTYMEIRVFVRPRATEREVGTSLYFDTDDLEGYLDLVITGPAQGTNLQLEKGRQRA